MTLTHGPCPRCGRDTVAGLSGNGKAAGLEVTVDSRPLNPAGELAALVAGCATWTLHTTADELHPRPAHVIAARPAGTVPRQTVHASHVCPGRTRP